MKILEKVKYWHKNNCKTYWDLFGDLLLGIDKSQRANRGYIGEKQGSVFNIWQPVWGLTRLPAVQQSRRKRTA